MQLQDVTWATRVNSFTRGDDGNDESESIPIKDTGCMAYSGPLSELFATKKDTKELKRSLDKLNEKMIEFATMNKGNSERLDSKIATIERDVAGLKENLED